MLDTKRLLDQFLSGQQPDQNQYGQPNQNQSPLGDLARSAGGMLSGNLGGIGGGAVAGGLVAVLLGSKSARKMAGNVATYGGMAALGALAYHAYRNYQAGQSPTTTAQTAASVPALPAPQGTPFNPASEAEQQSLGRHLLRAMIAAAKADGHVDATEQANIFAQMDRLNLSSDDKAFVVDELRRPLDIDSVAEGIRTPEEAAEIYAASLLAIDVDNPAERGYLGMLAARLKLDDKLVEHLHATIEGATEKSPAPAR
ncbi:MAG TPA: tellurite resistance TerB family protein [Xanthobacteraceae bacterium]|nr:tellurite resistance TerB family protein [Xanthobacteraceae bacterium]